MQTLRRLAAFFAAIVACAALVAPLGAGCASPQKAEPPPPVEQPPPYEEPPPIVIKKRAKPPKSERPSPVEELATPPAPATPPPIVDGPPPVGMDPKKTMTVHLLNVGQGAATLIELPCAAVLVDTGGELNESFDGPAALIAALDAFFARRTDLKRTIDLLVITHPHIDHVKGVPALLDSFAVKNIVDNGRPGDDIVREEMRRLRAYAQEGRVGYRNITVDQVGKQGLTDAVIDPAQCRPVDPKIRVLGGAETSDPGWGQDRFGHAYFDNENNHSVVLRVDFGKASILITGDLEEIALKALVAKYAGTDALDVDVYEVGHHGAANGTTQELLDAMTPDVALISMGAAERRLDWTAWQYGHPRQRTVDLLEGSVRHRRAGLDVEVGVGQRKFKKVRLERAIYGTGWDGTVVVDMTADGAMTVRPPPRGRAISGAGGSSG